MITGCQLGYELSDDDKTRSWIEVSGRKGFVWLKLEVTPYRPLKTVLIQTVLGPTDDKVLRKGRSVTISSDFGV